MFKTLVIGLFLFSSFSHAGDINKTVYDLKDIRKSAVAVLKNVFGEIKEIGFFHKSFNLSLESLVNSNESKDDLLFVAIAPKYNLTVAFQMSFNGSIDVIGIEAERNDQGRVIDIDYFYLKNIILSFDEEKISESKLSEIVLFLDNELKKIKTDKVKEPQSVTNNFGMVVVHTAKVAQTLAMLKIINNLPASEKPMAVEYDSDMHIPENMPSRAVFLGTGKESRVIDLEKLRKGKTNTKPRLVLPQPGCNPYLDE